MYAYRPPYRVGFGGFFVTDAIDSVAQWVLDRGHDLAQSVPGGGWIEGAVNGGAKVVVDLGSSAAGKTILTVISTGLGGMAYANLVPYVGAQAAAVAFALPGVLQGQKFGEAWVADFTDRVKKTIEYFASNYGDAAAKQYLTEYGQTVQTVATNAGVANLFDKNAIDALRRSGLTSQQALAALHIDPKTLNLTIRSLPLSLPAMRDDAVAQAINAIMGERVYDVSGWDIATGAAPDSTLDDGSANPNLAHFLAALPNQPLRSIRSLRGNVARTVLSQAQVDRQNSFREKAGIPLLPPSGLVFGTTPEKAKKVREAGLVLAMLAPTALALLFLKLPTKKRRG